MAESKDKRNTAGVDILSRDEWRKLQIMTDMYHLNLEPGEFTATLQMKAEGCSGILRLFFKFDDGRLIIAPVYWWNRYLGFYEIPVNTRVLLTYTQTAKGTYLTGAKIPKENAPAK